MDTSRVKLALMLAAVFYGVGLGVLYLVWPWLLENLSPLFPYWVADVTTGLAFGGLYTAIAGLNVGLLPRFNRWRILLDMLGCAAFSVTLLIQRNGGNVALEVAGVLLTIWSLKANHAQHEAISASAKMWVKGIAFLLLWLLVGALVAVFWPGDKLAQSRAWYWETCSVLGALIIFCGLVALETGVMHPTHPVYRVIYGIGCVLLVLSYFGQFNFVGVWLNTALAGVVYSPLVWQLVKRLRAAREPEPAEQPM